MPSAGLTDILIFLAVVGPLLVLVLAHGRARSPRLRMLIAMPLVAYGGLFLLAAVAFILLLLANAALVLFGMFGWIDL